LFSLIKMIMKRRSLPAFLLLFMPLMIAAQVKCGADRTGVYYPLLKNKSIAVVANAASVVHGVNVVDTLIGMGLKVEKIFCPEHGFRQYSDAGQTVKNNIDEKTHLPVISLYGKKKKPEPADLKEIDIVVFDLQDVGVRFYTYLSTLSYVMEACAKENIPLLLFDRPNPNAFFIDGPVMDSTEYSFIGLHPVPVVYGMTIGEYARMINEEGWLANRAICDLQVVQLEAYTHHAPIDLPAFPSPNLKSMEAVFLYPSLGFFEGTVVSVGRGTLHPFEMYGSPDFKGFSFEFTPQANLGATNPLYNGKLCRGIDLHDFYKTHPKLVGRINLSWMIMAFKTLGSTPSFFNDFFDKLAGTPELKKQILEGKSEQEIRQSWQPGLDRFRQIRAKYLLYPE
jgi:uncharacterized protein YbbC (DUF1343 family)